MRFLRFGASGPLACLAGALSFGIAAGCSQSAPPDPDPSNRTAAISQGIQGGTDDGTAHPYAVGVCAGAKGNCQGFCSGALILPNVVATARHCVNQTPKSIDCKANPPIRFGADEGVNWITTNNRMNQGTLGWHQVDQIIVPNDDRVCGHDIALLILKDVIGAAEAKPVIPGVQYRMGDFARYDRSFTAIGFGNTSPQGFTAGTRRIRSGIGVVCIPNDPDWGCPADAEVNDNEFVGGDGTCEGDSGSSSYETRSFLKGAPVSFGVLSRGGQSPDGLTCKGSVYSRFDTWRDLVVQVANSASKSWTLYPKPTPDWTIYVPPPPDAGAPEAGPPKKPTNLADGFACENNSECASKVCADTGGGKACTLACDEAVPGTCYEGMICKGTVCVVDVGGAPAAAPGGSSTTTSGCSVGAGGSTSMGAAAWGSLGVAAALGLILGRRRRETAAGRPV